MLDMGCVFYFTLKSGQDTFLHTESSNIYNTIKHFIEKKLSMQLKLRIIKKIAIRFLKG